MLPTHHLTVVDGIVTTRVARTLVDLAGAVHPARAERAVDNCLAKGVVTLAVLASVTQELAAKGRTAIALMRELLEARGGGCIAPESELEARFLALVRRAGLPEPGPQLHAGDHSDWVGRADYGYAANRVLVELDSRRHHTALLDAESDRGRDNRLTAGGWRVIRFSWSDVVERPEAVVAQIGRAHV